MRSGLVSLGGGADWWSRLVSLGHSLFVCVNTELPVILITPRNEDPSVTPSIDSNVNCSLTAELRHKPASQ